MRAPDGGCGVSGYVIRVIDFETTGTEPPAAQVCEVGYCDLTKAHDAAPWVVGLPVSWLCGVDTMPPEVRAVHHIRLADVEGLPPFEPGRLFEGVTVGAIAAHNYAFEAGFLGPHEVPAICTYKAALRVWPDAPGHSNSVLRYWLEDRGALALDDALAQPTHRAGPDAYITAHILAALLKRATGAQMAAWTRQPPLLPTCPIGKEWRGKAWADVDAGFLGWMLRQPDMEADLKWNAQRELDRRKSEQ